MMNTPLNVLFLCTGNSCRSIIGEALADHLGQGKLHGLSAGSMPTGKVNENALAVLSRHGVSVNNPGSKSMDDLEGERIDLVITVCDAAAGESCPVWLGDTPKVHWGLEVLPTLLAAKKRFGLPLRLPLTSCMRVLKHWRHWIWRPSIRWG